MIFNLKGGVSTKEVGTPWCRKVAVGAVSLHEVVRVNYRTILCVLWVLGMLVLKGT